MDPLHYEILMGIERAEGRAGLAVHVFAFWGGQPGEDIRWCAGVRDVPAHPAALELAGLLRALTMTEPRAFVQISLADGASVPFVFAPGTDGVDPVTEDLRGRVHDLLRARRFAFEQVGEGETPRLLELKEAARRAAATGYGRRPFEELVRLSADAGPVLGPRSMRR